MAVFIASAIYGFATKIVRSLVSAKVFDFESSCIIQKFRAAAGLHSCVLSLAKQSTPKICIANELMTSLLSQTPTGKFRLNVICLLAEGKLSNYFLEVRGTRQPSSLINSLLSLSDKLSAAVYDDVA